MRKLFGTDGVRGMANSEPMTPETIMKLAACAGMEFLRGGYQHRVVIAKDTRLSGYLFEPSLVAGFVSVGMFVLLVGPVPTPAVSFLTQSLRADLGVMISASHNPYWDNGIKFFGPDGYKLSDEIEARIENRMTSELSGFERATKNKLGRVLRLDDAGGRYIEKVKQTFRQNLQGLKVVVDCANGASYKIAPTILWELGADVITINAEPNGTNINDSCGATSPFCVAKAVLEHGADVGIALDGDADRLILSDEKGNIIDGDQILGLIAKSWHQNNKLKQAEVVSTVMSNIGLEKFLNSFNVSLIRTRVGDRYVSEAMRQRNINVGGEQSGHVILSDYSSTGDGTVAALQVLSVLIKSGKRMSEIGKAFDPMPQFFENVKIVNRDALEHQSIKDVIEKSQNKLGSDGRLLVRASGTEPLLRIMAEGENVDLLKQIVSEVSEIVRKKQPAA